MSKWINILILFSIPYTGYAHLDHYERVPTGRVIGPFMEFSFIHIPICMHMYDRYPKPELFAKGEMDVWIAKREAGNEQSLEQ